MTSESPTKTVSLLLFLVGALLLFVLFSLASSWVTLRLRNFSIPVEGGPHLSTADDWRSELDTLSNDIGAFWRAELAAVSRSYTPPKIIAPLEGRRAVCGGLVETEATVYCARSSTIELTRIQFNATSRASSAGENHLAVAYTVTRLMARQTQSALGAELAKAELADAKTRIELDLQAECLAGFWLRRGAARYGVVSEADLRRAVGRARSGQHVGAPAPEGVLIEDFLRAPIDQRIEWARKGFFAQRLSECAASLSPDTK